MKETESPVQAQASVEPQQTEEPKPQQTPQESKPQQTATSTDAVDTSLAVLEARCKRFGIPFDPSKYTKRANSRPSKSEVGDRGKRPSVARATAGDATEAVWSAERTIGKADGGSFGERPREARGAQKAIWTPVLCFLDTHSLSRNKQAIPCGASHESTAQSPFRREDRGTASGRPCRTWPSIEICLHSYGELVERVASSVGEDERLVASVGRVVVVEVEVGRELHHGLLGDAVEPEHVLVLDDARVVAVHLAPAVGVMAALRSNHPRTPTAVLAQCGSVKNSLVSSAYLVSG